MSVLPIVYIPDPVLRRKAKKITEFDRDLQTLIDNMVETMREAPGVGLAAPQVGESIRLLVVEYEENDEVEDSPKKLYVLINPELTPLGEELVTGVEGCLSVPDLVGEVERYEAVQIKALNRRGQPVKIKAKGWLARIFQHEYDHLEGVIYTDRATRVWKPREDEELEIAD